MNKFYLVVAAALFLVASFYFLSENSGPVGSMGEVLNESEKLICGITAEVTEGPYYVSGVPQLTGGNLNYTNLAGSPLTVSGYVYEGLDTERPIVNATVDLWQTDTEGNYHPNANGQMSEYSVADIALRGTVVTDLKGFYSFTTIYPGEYTGRARHIHAKIRADGFKEVTTQLILALPGDDVSFDEDTVSQGLPKCHVLSRNDSTPPSGATFDFRLAK
jgi:protocatechuate 3,4-dioxygenase beta subunit